MRQKSEGKTLTIVGDGNQRRDFVYVGDICNANITAALSDVDYEAYGQVYNVGTGTNVSVNQIARMIGGETTNLAPRPGEVRFSLANNQKIKKTFGWEPTMKLEDWISANA
jgi:UDP-glucose 4-epimerase